MSKLKNLIEKVKVAASDPQNTEVIPEVEDLVQWLQDHPDKAQDVDSGLLRTLRSGRHFAALGLLADRLNGLGHSDPAVRLMLAQGLIDTGAPSTAIDVLRRMRGKSVDDATQVEVSGLMGRAFKDIYQSLRSARDTRAGTVLNLAVGQYSEAFEKSGETSFWTGENLLALLRRAKVLGISVDSKHTLESLTAQIKVVITEVPVERRAYWHWATLAVAHISDDDWGGAGDALATALRSDGADPFSLAGTIRQLREWWDIDESGPDGAGLIAALQARLLQMQGGQLNMTGAQLNSVQRVPDNSFEKIFGPNGPRTHAWMLQFVSAGASVGQVKTSLGEGVGTCFVVLGKEFHPDLGEEKLILTNDHVVSPFPEKYSSNPPLRVNKSKVRFEIFAQEQGPCEIAAQEIVWSSGSQDHDACLIRLAEPVPADVPVMNIVRYVPIVEQDSGEGIYVIGHPGGRTLSYSMQNNELLDHDCKSIQDDVSPCRIHYFTPTEPGSSGSPALNAELDVIGLHHAGGRYMRKLNGQDGTYAANEAIWIDSICRAAGRDLAAGRNRYAP